MSDKKPRNILLNSKIAVGIGLAILLVLGLALIAQGFVDTRDYRDQVIDAIQAQTHKKVTIKGTVGVALLPVPTLYIPGVELRDPNSEQPTPSASVELISIRVTLMSAFEGHPKISAILLDHPVLQLIRGDDNLVHWDWLNTDLLKALTASEDSNKSLAVEITNGKIIYHDNSTDKTVSLENINAKAMNGNSLSAYGYFTCYGHEISFTADRDSSKATDSTTPFHLKLTSGASDFVELKGEIDVSKELPQIKGEMSLDLADAAIWIKPKQVDNEKLIDRVTNQISGIKREKIPLPLKISSNWSQTGLSVMLDNLHLEGLNSVGVGKIGLEWNDWQPKISVDMSFSSLNFDQWKKYLSSAFVTTKKNNDFYSKVYHSTDELPENPLPKNIEVSVNVIADKVNVGGQNWSNAKLSAVMAESAITVNQFGVELPGKSVLTMFGVVTPSSTNDLRFEGSMETKGKSMREMLTIFDESAAGLPETGLGEFSARSNIFVSSEQLRLSDADVRLSDLHLNGGLVAYFDSTVRLEADLNLKNINFDYFRDVWREKQQKEKNADFFLKFDRSISFDWLKKLQTTIDFRVNVDHFTFFDHDGDNASFRVYARSGDLGIYDINFIYPTDIMKGHLDLNVNGEQPFVDIGMSIGFLDTGYFNVEPYTGDAQQKKTELQLAPVDKQPSSNLDDKNKLYLSSLDIADSDENGFKLKVEPQADIQTVSTPNDDGTLPPKPLTGVDDLIKNPKMKSPLADNAIYHRWSEDLIDMSWMNGLSGSIDLSIGKLTHKNLKFENVKLQTKFSNNLMIFNTLTFSYWGGQCSILGSLYGGKVPGFVVSVAMSDMHIGEMLKDLIDRDNIYGNVSINATLNTSGVNMLSWVSQAEGKMVLVGRGINVRGLNLPGVVDAVMVSRTASDVVNSVSARLIDGSTTFSVDGNINIKNGMLRTPGIALKSDAILGNLIGEVKLINWTMDLSTLFQFPELSTETVPTMSIQVTGPLKSGDMQTDTSSLEAFVAKRIISK